MHRRPQPVKLYAVASMYRYAAPQRGGTASTGSFWVEAIGSATLPSTPSSIQLYAERLRRSASRSTGCR